MKKYLISYVSQGGFVVLNHEISATSFTDAITQIKGDIGVRMVLSCVNITHNE